jgi:hypothetical protein
VRTIASLVLVVSLIVVTYRWIESIGGPGTVRDRFGATGLAVSVLAHWILNLTPLGEVVPMVVANGAIWGFWLGALVSWSGWMGASLTQYLLVRRMGTEQGVEARVDRIPKRIRSLPIDHPAFQVAGRSLLERRSKLRTFCTLSAAMLARADPGFEGSGRVMALDRHDVFSRRL